MWDTVFNIANLLALAMWAILILLPRRPFAMALVLYCGVGLLCLTYVVLLVGLVSGVFDPVREAGAGAAKCPPPSSEGSACCAATPSRRTSGMRIAAMAVKSRRDFDPRVDLSGIPNSSCASPPSVPSLAAD